MERAAARHHIRSWHYSINVLRNFGTAGSLVLNKLRERGSFDASVNKQASVGVSSHNLAVFQSVDIPHDWHSIPGLSTHLIWLCQVFFQRLVNYLPQTFDEAKRAGIQLSTPWHDRPSIILQSFTVRDLTNVLMFG